MWIESLKIEVSSMETNIDTKKKISEELKEKILNLWIDENDLSVIEEEYNSEHESDFYTEIENLSQNINDSWVSHFEVFLEEMDEHLSYFLDTQDTSEILSVLDEYITRNNISNNQDKKEKVKGETERVEGEIEGNMRILFILKNSIFEDFDIENNVDNYDELKADAEENLIAFSGEDNYDDLVQTYIILENKDTILSYYSGDQAKALASQIDSLRTLANDTSLSATLTNPRHTRNQIAGFLKDWWAEGKKMKAIMDNLNIHWTEDLEFIDLENSKKVLVWNQELVFDDAWNLKAKNIVMYGYSIEVWLEQERWFEFYEYRALERKVREDNQKLILEIEDIYTEVKDISSQIQELNKEIEDISNLEAEIYDNEDVREDINNISVWTIIENLKSKLDMKKQQIEEKMQKVEENTHRLVKFVNDNPDADSQQTEENNAKKTLELIHNIWLDNIPQGEFENFINNNLKTVANVSSILWWDFNIESWFRYGTTEEIPRKIAFVKFVNKMISWKEWEPITESDISWVITWKNKKFTSPWFRDNLIKSWIINDAWVFNDKVAFENIKKKEETKKDEK